MLNNRQRYRKQNDPGAAISITLAHLSTLSPRLHDEPKYTVARAAHGKSAQQLVLERLRLSTGARRHTKLKPTQPPPSKKKLVILHAYTHFIRLFRLRAKCQTRAIEIFQPCSGSRRRFTHGFLDHTQSGGVATKEESSEVRGRSGVRLHLHRLCFRFREADQRAHVSYLKSLDRRFAAKKDDSKLSHLSLGA